MGTKRAVYTNEFRHDAVRLVLEEGLTKAETGRRLGVNQSLLGKWVKAYKKVGDETIPKVGQILEQEELRRLRKENRQLKMEREILKKATVFFAKEKR